MLIYNSQCLDCNFNFAFSCFANVEIKLCINLLLSLCTGDDRALLEPGTDSLLFTLQIQVLSTGVHKENMSYLFFPGCQTQQKNTG